MPTASIYNWIYRGWITARHAPGTRNWIITADDQQMRQLRERRARPPGLLRPRPLGTRQQGTNPTRNKEHSHEKAAQLDRCQRWPTSTGQLSPAALISRVLVSELACGHVAVVEGQLAGLQVAADQQVSAAGEAVTSQAQAYHRSPLDPCPAERTSQRRLRPSSS